jgi:hypothetical protein
MAQLSQSQLEAWRRTRVKGQKRVIAQQFLAWSAIGLGGPTLRALVQCGSGAAVSYWSGDAAIGHLAVGLGVGVAGALIFGAFSWSRMERLYAEATRTTSGSRSEGVTPRVEGREGP